MEKYASACSDLSTTQHTVHRDWNGVCEYSESHTRLSPNFRSRETMKRAGSQLMWVLTSDTTSPGIHPKTNRKLSKDFKLVSHMR